MSSDEAEDDPGTQDSNTLDDIVIASDCKSVQLRRERMGNGNGRVYTIELGITNSDGTLSTTTFKASVPLWAWGWNSTAVEDDAMYTEWSNCHSNPGTARELMLQQQTWNASLTKQEPLVPLLNNLQVYPNPFTITTTIDFQLSDPGPASLTVFNLQGQALKKLMQTNLPAGEHQFNWDGRDDSGQRLPAGIYLLQLKSGKKVVVKKVNLMSL